MRQNDSKTVPFRITETDLPGLKAITPFFAADERGFLLKYFEDTLFKENGISFSTAECFESLSVQYVLRGIHFQTNYPQAKLVRVVYGEIWDVAVDLRENSPAFLRWHARALSGENREALYIPPGFGHGFFVVSKQALVNYQCAGAYDKESDTGIIWNDQDICIPWPIPPGISPLVSQRDAGLQTARDMKGKLFDYEG